ncbi:MAG: hypothetical protein QOE10_158, partial [Gaiellales bacterium]|nr:hypothetical protein [Gaiellales bacterium]
HRLSGEALEIIAKSRVSRPIRKLSTQMVTRQPAGPLTVGHDVGDRLAVHGEDYPLTGPHGVDDLTRPVAKLAYTDLHVLHRSTTRVSPAPPRQRA